MRNSMMKKRIMAIAASALVSVSSATGAIGGFVAPMANTMTTATAAEASVKISSAVGYAEGMYATWGAVSGASGYNVYVDGTQIDSELIRQYSGYMRADAVGLKAGSHTIKVVPIISGTPDTSKAAEAKADVYAHDRSGYAFADGHAQGA
jgi:prepilin-type processing-associated H-X9-DG protein